MNAIETRISLHRYVTDPLLPQKDGANLAHENITTLLTNCMRPEIETRFHGFVQILENLDFARSALADVDCIVSNVGPHAHFYFWLRERLGLNFRIIRDARTAIWSSYLLQEHLCKPLLRETDTLIVASHYAWGIYEKMFPHLSNFPTAVCYPLAICFPEIRPDRGHKSLTRNHEFTLGYLGRLSEDKNFPDIVELLIRLNQVGDRKYRLIACGDIHSSSCSPDSVRARLNQALGSDAQFEYCPACSNELIWPLLARFDALIFPSTSNLETFGRVLIEASYARLPVVSADHAAAAELVVPAGLCPVRYKLGENFSAHFDHQLGRASLDDMAHAITQGQLAASDCYERYRQHPEKFLDLIECSPKLDKPSLSTSQAAFINALEVDLPREITRREANSHIANLRNWFVDLHCRDESVRSRRFDELMKISQHPERTANFIRKSRTTGGDFTNIGGMDIELCHIVNFYPEFRMSHAPSPAAHGEPCLLTG